MSKLVKNSFLYLVATIVLKATHFLLLPLYSNLIPPDGYGKVYVISSFISFFTIFLSISMNSAIQRYFFDCKTEFEVKRMFSTVTLFVFAISTSISAILFLLISPISIWLDIPKVYLSLGIITVYLSLFYNLIIALLYAKQEAVKISVVSIIVGVAQIVAQLVLVLNMEDKALGMIISMLVSGILNMIIFVLFARKYLIWGFDFSRIKNYFVYGISQFPSDISSWIVSFFDRIILNNYQNSAAVGIYGMGNTLASIPNVLFQSMNKALSPIVFTDYKQYEDREVDSLNTSTNLIEKIFVLITALIAVVIAFSNNIVSILSSSYSESGIVMYLVLFAMLIDIYRILFMYPMVYNVKYVKVKSMIWILASATSIALNFILIPKYSYMGACYTLLIVNTTTLLLIFYFSSKAMVVDYKKGRMIMVFILSLAYSCLYFLGSSIYMFIVKFLVTAVYCILINRIVPLNMKGLLNQIRRKK